MRSDIFGKYLLPEDRDLVNQVFQNIIGTDQSLHSGASAFADVTVDLDDSENKCSEKGSLFLAFVDARSYKRIVICRLFWNKSLDDVPHLMGLFSGTPPSCQRVGSTVSDQMNFPALLMLHESL